MSDYPHALVGGNPALDFLNTIHDWQAVDRVDRLSTWADALRFASATGVISPADSKILALRRGGDELTRLVELRDLLERISGALLAGKAPAVADLEQMDRETAEAAGAARLFRSRSRLVQRVEVALAGVATPRYRVVEAARSLLLSPQWERVKRCPRCGWFFLDTSKNGSRRWCSMAMCGTAVKTQAYYRRTRGKGR